MKSKYTLIQAIGVLNSHPKIKFARYSDFRFILYRGSRGDLLFNIEAKSEECKVKNKVLPIYNYMQDLWVIVN